MVTILLATIFCRPMMINFHLLLCWKTFTFNLWQPSPINFQRKFLWQMLFVHRWWSTFVYHFFHNRCWPIFDNYFISNRYWQSFDYHFSIIVIEWLLTIVSQWYMPINLRLLLMSTSGHHFPTLLQSNLCRLLSDNRD